MSRLSVPRPFHRSSLRISQSASLWSDAGRPRQWLGLHDWTGRCRAVLWCCVVLWSRPTVALSNHIATHLISPDQLRSQGRDGCVLDRL